VKPRAVPRRRRTAEEARHEILAAAQRRLVDGGPEAIRLQDIARDLGISHPTILHHFESREKLMRALARSAIGALNEDVLQAIVDRRHGPSPAPVLDRIFETLGESGHARLLAWAALSPHTPQPGDDEHQLLRRLAEAIRERTAADARRGGGIAPSAGEIVFVVRLTAAAMLGDALLGSVLSRSAGLADHASVDRRFRLWLARVLEERLQPRPRRRRRGIS
jgi:AcrR family transcriptional regulator